MGAGGAPSTAMGLRTGLGTASGAASFGTVDGQVPEGKMTSTVYGLIAKQDYAEAARVLVIQLQQFPRSRAGLSLLGYCYYQLQDFRSAAQTYE